MAIDTARKRYNVAQIGAPLAISVLPNGSIDGFERAQLAWTYGGIGIAPPPVQTLLTLALMGVGL